MFSTTVVQVGHLPVWCGCSKRGVASHRSAAVTQCCLTAYSTKGCRNYQAERAHNSLVCYIYWQKNLTWLKQGFKYLDGDFKGLYYEVSVYLPFCTSFAEDGLQGRYGVE